MPDPDYRSKCCNAEVRSDGVPDFMGSDEICTISFSCLKCGNACDVVSPAEKDRCVVCGKETEYAKDTHVDVRKNYIEGAGQLCPDCGADICC